MAGLNEENYLRLLDGLILSQLRERTSGLSKEELRQLALAEYGALGTAYLPRWLKSRLRLRIVRTSGFNSKIIDLWSQSHKVVEHIRPKPKYL